MGDAIRDGIVDISKYVADPTNTKLRDEVNAALRTSLNSGQVTYEDLGKYLPELGLSGDLARSELSYIDGTGGNPKDKSLSVDEVNMAANNSSADPLTVLAANNLKHNFDTVTSKDFWTDPMQWNIGGFGARLLWPDQIEDGELATYARDVRNSSSKSVTEFFGPGDGTVSDVKLDPGAPVDKTLPVDKLEDIVGSRTATPQQRLEAAMYLYNQNHHSLSVTEADGSSLNVVINADSNGMISLFANDGQPRPVLRGVVRNGVVSQQGSSSFYGDQWQKRHPNSVFAPAV